MSARNLLAVTARRGMAPDVTSEAARGLLRDAENELLEEFLTNLRTLAGGCCEECDAVLELADGLAATHG